MARVWKASALLCSEKCAVGFAKARSARGSCGEAARTWANRRSRFAPCAARIRRTAENLAEKRGIRTIITIAAFYRVGKVARVWKAAALLCSEKCAVGFAKARSARVKLRRSRANLGEPTKSVCSVRCAHIENSGKPRRKERNPHYHNDCGVLLSGRGGEGLESRCPALFRKMCSGSC